MSNIEFTTSNDGNTYFATSEKAAYAFAEKKGLGSIFVKEGSPDKEDLRIAKKVGANVWLAAD